MACLRCAIVGGSIELHARFDSEEVAKGLETCSGASLVPTMAWRLCKLPHQHYDHQPIILLGGAASEQSLVETLSGRGAIPLRCYGATETAAMICCQNHNDINAPHNGKPLPSCEARIAADGSLSLRGPVIAQRSFQRPEY